MSEEQEAGHQNARTGLYIGIVLVLMVAFLCGVLGPSRDAVLVKAVDANRAAEAIKLMKDWGVWMAGIQTATLAAVGIFAKEGALNFKLGKLHIWILLWTVLLNTAALFSSAWLLTSTSSVMLRLGSDRWKDNNDFYLWPIFSFMKNDNPITIGYVAVVNHWLWALGILCFGTLTIAVAFKRIYQPAPAATPSLIAPEGYAYVLVPASKQSTLAPEIERPIVPS